ncbi:MAG: M28 family peptidase [Myxococcaceae bacterium]|nr:M28 family peptidase [Myxococcaceae bacterium]
MRAAVLLAALAGSACLHRMPEVPQTLTGEDRATAESLRTTVHTIIDARFNPSRLRAAEARATELALTPTREWIDWWSFQHNVVIELPGKTDRLVYLVAHGDKTDANPLKVVSLLVNGLIDEVTGLTYLGEGALDNATGVAVVLQVAHVLRSLPRGPTVRVLIPGAEESGLRGSRAHAARLSNDEWARLDAVINVDSVGKAGEKTCLVSNHSDPGLGLLAHQVARARGVELGREQMPGLAGGDHEPFMETSFFHDFGRSLMFNAIGGLLPQRSWFTGFHKAKVVSFWSCHLLDAGDGVAALVALPVGALHGPRDNASVVDPQRLFEAYTIVEGLTRALVVPPEPVPPPPPTVPEPPPAESPL